MNDFLTGFWCRLALGATIWILLKAVRLRSIGVFLAAELVWFVYSFTFWITLLSSVTLKSDVKFFKSTWFCFSFIAILDDMLNSYDFWSFYWRLSGLECIGEKTSCDSYPFRCYTRACWSWRVLIRFSWLRPSSLFICFNLMLTVLPAVMLNDEVKSMTCFLLFT